MSNATLRNVHRKYYGDEPDFSKSEPTPIQLLQAYNWYNHLYSPDDAKAFVADYLKHIKHPKASSLHFVPASNLHSLGWNCRIILRGGKLPADIWTRATKKLDEYLNSVVKPTHIEQPETAEEKKGDKPFISIQQRVINKASDLRSEIEEQIDMFIIENKKSDFNVRQFFIKNEIKAGIAQIIANHYKALYQELFDVLAGKDKELVDSYSYMSKTVLKAYLEFVKSIISTAEERAASLKANKRQRKKKEKPASVIVGKLQFKDKHEKFVSINPTQIVGCNQLWVYNVKYRNLTVYNAMGPVGLSVKGTTITGFDPKTSITKKLRKPEQPLQSVLDGGKVVLRKLMDSIKTQGKEATGRINKDTVLMRVIR